MPDDNGDMTPEEYQLLLQQNHEHITGFREKLDALVNEYFAGDEGFQMVFTMRTLRAVPGPVIFYSHSSFAASDLLAAGMQHMVTIMHAEAHPQSVMVFSPADIRRQVCDHVFGNKWEVDTPGARLQHEILSAMEVANVATVAELSDEAIEALDTLIQEFIAATAGQEASPN